MKSNLKRRWLKTKMGMFALEMSAKGLYAVRFPESPSFLKRGKGRFFKSPLVPLCKRGKSWPLDLSGCTLFQLRVYAALQKVPKGTVITYGELAKRAGYPGAARAVGSAMKKNRLPIVIPCHRIVPACGGIGGYSAGVKWKRWLLEYEKGTRSSGLGTRKNEEPKRVPRG